jgi:hypothetical protein
MKEELLENIQALLLSQRARDIRLNTARATFPEDVEEVLINGESVAVLTMPAALRSALEEMLEVKRLIAEFSAR